MRVMNAVMICVLALALGESTLAADDKIDSGMSTERLRRVGMKLKEFVDAMDRREFISRTSRAVSILQSCCAKGATMLAV